MTVRWFAFALLGLTIVVAGPSSLFAQQTTATPLMTKDLPEFAGKEVVVSTVTYPAGVASAPHRHDAHTFVYVLEGTADHAGRRGRAHDARAWADVLRESDRHPRHVKERQPDGAGEDSRVHDQGQGENGIETGELEQVRRYHDGTKHHFRRFARSLGYLDWASQPKPFRSFNGSRLVPLYPAPAGEPIARRPAPTYDALFDEQPATRDSSGLAIGMPSLGFFLRHALGLSAWKTFASSRWSLRVNPSSGNLHPTEAYVVCGEQVWHYDSERHVFEERCAFDASVWATAGLDPSRSVLVALTSIHWRESWKYR